MRKAITILAAAMMSVFFGMTAFADNAGFAVESERVFDVLAPYDKGYVQIAWGTAEHETCGVPIADGDSVLLPSGHTVSRISEKNGEVLAAAELTEKVSESQRGALIGKTLIQPARTSLFAVDTETMTVKTSRKFGEIVTDVAVRDNLVYFGVKAEDAYSFVCVDFETLETVREYKTEFPVTSPALLGNHVIFGSGENLVSVTDSTFAENPVGAEITHIFAGKYAVFMSCGDGSLRKLRLDDGGKAEPESLMSVALDGELTAPVEYDNRVYVGSSEGFFVLDGLNMEIARSFPELKGSTESVVCIGGGRRAYTVAPHDDANGDRWYVYAVLDGDDGISAEEIAKIIDFTDGKTAVSASGTMYFRDARGQLWALVVSKTSALMIILKIVLTLAIIVMALLIIRAWTKKRSAQRHKF